MDYIDLRSDTVTWPTEEMRKAYRASFGTRSEAVSSAKKT